MRILLDCDTGIDDAFALTYLACHPEAELVGIVSTAGNVTQDQVLRNNLGLATMLGLQMPVARGSDVPLVQELMTAEDTHGPTGLGEAVLPDPDRDPDPRSGAQLWADLARAHPGELTGLLVGPATNLALALEIEPDLPHLLSSLHIMGGAVNYRGNTGATSEWNVAVDPEAMARVLCAFADADPLPVLAGLDATEAVRFTQRELDAVAALPPHPVRDVLTRALEFYFAFHESDGFGWSAHVHDPLVAAHAVTGRFLHTQPLPVDVELAGTLTRGQTVADVLGRWDKPATVRSARSADADAFVEHLFTTLRTGLAQLPVSP